MENDIYTLPPVEITEEEDRIFTLAECLLDCLQVCGVRLSREGMICHLEHLGVTEAQMPALLDTAERRRLIPRQPEPEQPDSLRLRTTGGLLLAWLEEGGITLREKERRLLELRFGLADGVPRSAAETAEALGISQERVLQAEGYVFRRVTHAWRRRRRRQRLREFYA